MAGILDWLRKRLIKALGGVDYAYYRRCEYMLYEMRTELTHVRANLRCASDRVQVLEKQLAECALLNKQQRTGFANTIGITHGDMLAEAVAKENAADDVIHINGREADAL